MWFFPPSLALAFTMPSVAVRPVHWSVTPSHRPDARMGFLDSLKKAFDNQDYSESPATYEQTNARASHIQVEDEALAQSLKAKLELGELEFSEAAMEYSTCKSAARGGKLGRFSPGTMLPEIDEIVFAVEDTGKINLGNGAAVYKPKYELGEVHGPIKSKLGYHLVKIEKRVIADFDFRAKEGALPKANVWEDWQGPLGRRLTEHAREQARMQDFKLGRLGGQGSRQLSALN
ncbi:hypothetical protein AB1Y20_006598 [Prymnesium parvum]|uniref:Peptidyl-prolyl cis-trans isomerase n=1 Tax=Prymnesium parvum TaxID=97485 RepID=A0AB34J126_PRYPA